MHIPLSRNTFGIIAGLMIGGLVSALQIPSVITQTTQFVRSVVIGDPSSPAVTIGGRGTQVLTINTTDQNGVWIEPGAFVNGSIMRPDLGFDIVENPISCPPGSGLLFRIDKNGNPDCRLVSSGDLDPSFHDIYQRRLQGPCPDNQYMVDVLKDGTVICRALDHDRLYTQLTTAFQDRLDGECPVGSFLIGVESNGTIKCLNTNVLMTSLGTCTDGFVAQGLRKTGSNPGLLELVCIPRKPQTQCPRGRVIIGITESGTPICSFMTIQACPAGHIYAGATKGCIPVGSLISGACPTNQWLRGINQSGNVLCANNASSCPPDHFANGFDTQGKLVCRSQFEWEARTTCNDVKCGPVTLDVEYACVSLAGVVVDDSKCTGPKPSKKITCEGTLASDSEYCKNTVTCGRNVALSKAGVGPHTIPIDFGGYNGLTCFELNPHYEQDTFTVCGETIALGNHDTRTICCSNSGSITVLGSSDTTLFNIKATCNPPDQMVKNAECERERGLKGIRDPERRKCIDKCEFGQLWNGYRCEDRCPPGQTWNSLLGCGDYRVTCREDQKVRRCSRTCVRQTDQGCQEWGEVCDMYCP